MTNPPRRRAIAALRAGRPVRIDGREPVAVVAVALLRRPGQSDQQRQPDHQPQPGAEEILAQRLARGEIDADEYRQRLQTLQETTSRP